MKSKVAVITLNWNGYEDTVKSVNSLLEQTYQSFDIYLIDNASSNDEGQKLKEKFADRVRFIQNDNNLGFAKAHNQAFKTILETGKYDYIALLNNDAFAEPEWLENIVKCAIEEKSDMVSSKMIKYFNQKEMDNAGHIMLNTGEVIPLGAHEGIGKFTSRMENLGACGGACLYSTKMLNDIGIFDDFFVTGYEDVELGVRAILAGYRSMYEPAAVAYHKGSVSINKIRSYEYILKIHRSILYTYFKTMPLGVIVCNLPFIFLKYIGISITSILFWRMKILKSHSHSLVIFFRNDFPQMMQKRKEMKNMLRISTLQVLKKQTFFPYYYLKYFKKFIINHQKTVFE